VIAEPQRGFKAAPISPEDRPNLTKVRIEIDSLCLRKAIEHGDVGVGVAAGRCLPSPARTPERVTGDPTRSSEEWPGPMPVFTRLSSKLRQPVADAPAQPAL